MTGVSDVKQQHMGVVYLLFNCCYMMQDLSLHGSYTVFVSVQRPLTNGLFFFFFLKHFDMLLTALTIV